jgi:hypothetical protein
MLSPPGHLRLASMSRLDGKPEVQPLRHFGQGFLRVHLPLWLMIAPPFLQEEFFSYRCAIA